MPNIMGNIANGSGLLKLVPNKEELIKKSTKQLEVAKVETKDIINIEEKKIEEISNLQILLSKVKATAGILINESGFNTKSATSLTQETVGVAADYITNIRVDEAASVGEIKIAVTQIAKIAKIVLASAAGIGFNSVAALGKTGNITLNVGGNARIIPIIASDTITQLVANINTKFANNSDAFMALLVKGDNNTSFIEVKAKNSGAGNITVAYDNGLGGPLGGGNLFTQNSEAGTDAIVYIDGIPRTQSSNNFINPVAGLSFELTDKINSANAANVAYGGLKYNTIKVSIDHSSVKKMITNFGDSINELSFFIAKNKQSIRSYKEDESPLDPSKPLPSYAGSGSPLYGSSLLREAESILMQFTTTKISAPGDIKSIYD